MARSFTVELLVEPKEETFDDNDYPVGGDLVMSIEEVLETVLIHGDPSFFGKVTVEYVEEVGGE